VRAQVLAGKSEAIEAICDRIASGEIAPAEAARGVLLALHNEHARNGAAQPAS